MFIFILVLLILVLVISYKTYTICFHTPAVKKDDPYEKMVGEQYEMVLEHIFNSTRIIEKAAAEDVETRSKDNLLLKGRYYHTKDKAPIQLLFHGYRSHPFRDCAGAYMLAKKMGFNVLVVDHRAHCKSDGRVITFGIKERYDCLTWAEYVSNRFPDSPIILGGLSMGAATVLMASELKLPENVCAIIADCPYSSPKAIIRKVCHDRNIPAWLIYPFVYLGAGVYGGFSLDECSASEAVKHTRTPILLVHGEEDRFVPCEMSKEIYRNCSGFSQIHTFPHAGHGLCYMTDPLRYEDVVTRFLWENQALRPYMAQNEFVTKELRGEMKY